MNQTPQSTNQNPPGFVATAINFITSFVSKPWQQALEHVQLKNKLAVVTFVLLLLGFTLPLAEVMNEELYLSDEVYGFVGFIFVASAIVAFITFATGTSEKIAKWSARIVLAIMVYALGSLIWELYDAYSEFSQMCDRQCQRMMGSMADEFGVGDAIFDSLKIGLIFFLAGFAMLFPVALTNRYQSNPDLVIRLKEINATETNAKTVSNEDIAAFGQRVKDNSSKLVTAAGQAVGSEEQRQQAISSAKQAFANPVVKRAAIGLGFFLMVWFLWPSSDTPDTTDAQIAFTKSSEYRELEKMASLAAMLGGSTEVDVTFTDIEDCKEAELSNSESGISCMVKGYISFGREKETIEERMYFSRDDDGEWRYRG